MDNTIDITFEAIAIKGDYGYGSEYDKNGLYRVDINSGKCLFINLFEGEYINKKRLHCSAEWIGDKIYFIPGSAQNVSIYDLKNGKIETINIPKPSKKKYPFYKLQYKFVGAVQCRNYLWLVPATYPGILKLNLLNNEIKVYDDWIPEDGYMFRRGMHIDNNKIIIPSGNNNYVLTFDLDKESAQLLKIGKLNNGMMSMCKVGESYWLAPRKKGAIILWNPHTDFIHEYNNYPDLFEFGQIVFSNVYSYNENVFFVPARANECLTIKDGKLVADNHLRWKSDADSMVEFLFETDSDQYYREIFGDGHSRYFKLNNNDNLESSVTFWTKPSKEIDRMMLEKMIFEKEFLEENDIFNLEWYLSTVKEGK